MNTLTAYAAAALVLLTAAEPVAAATIWDEASHGDLSGDGAAPTPLVVAPGENAWSGQVGLTAAPAPDSDLVAFTVPDGYYLTSLRFDRYDESPDIGGGSFLAVAAGTTVDTGFGSVHLSNALVDAPGEWLDDLATGALYGSPSALVTGLTAPLPAGEYVVWLGEISTLIDYTLVATIAVPEPTGVPMIAGVLTTVAAAWRRVRH